MGKIAAKILANGDGWNVTDLVCTAGPRDRPFEEQHQAWSISIVLQGSFRYRSSAGSAIMFEGALLLGQGGQYFECSHEHGTGDHCLSFHYTPKFIEECGAAPFRIPRIPPMPQLSSLTAMAALAAVSPSPANFDEMAKELICTVGEIINPRRSRSCAPTAADERRVSAALRFIEAHPTESLPLCLLASTAKVSEFHFLRMFRSVTGVTPHQYILRLRLRQAAIGLASRPDNVVDIATAVGFSDLSNFNLLFRTEFGVSPVAFRSCHECGQRLAPA